MSAAYLQAAIPQPFTVLGRKLKPFTLGHQLLLEYFGSGFALGSDESPTYEDLLISVFLCSYSYEDALKKLESRWLVLQLKLWSWFCGNFDVGEAIEFFQRYIGAHTKEPDFWVTQKSGPSHSGIPFIQFLKVKLEQELGYTEQQALDTPYQIAVWNYLTFLEHKGVIRFFNSEDFDLLEASQSEEMDRKLQAFAEKIRPQMEAMANQKN